MLKTRLATGLPLAAVTIAAFCWRGFPGSALFLLLAAVFVSVAVHEFFGMMDKLKLPGFRLATILAAIGMLVGNWYCGRWGKGGESLGMAFDAMVGGIFLLFLFLALCRHVPGRASLSRLLVSIGALGYVVWPLLFLAKLYFQSGGMSGRLLVLYLVLITKMGDVGAFIVGTTTARRKNGNHKLAPSLSPKKSWEGLAGGLVFSLVASLAMVHFGGARLTLHGTPVLGLFSAAFLAVFCTLAGLLGDLAESFLKRASDTKDSGRIPGLGGVLDIVDSLIPVAPVFYAYVHIAQHFLQ
ncbi:MAG: phosphatidate cytidylyltransferase [Lentisphaeria bacterium]|nr:phosphatidate cytidylyltransferase [Lentisphaeria bacterium]